MTENDNGRVLSGDFINKKVVVPSGGRGVIFDRKRQVQYSMQKGLQKPGRVSFDVLRQAVSSVHIARICVNVLKEKVTKTRWTIQPINRQEKVDEKQIKELTHFFNNPNGSNETFRTFVDKVLEDLLILDAAAIEKTRYPDGKLAEMHYVDAATIRPVFDIHGNQDVEMPIRNSKGETHILPVSYVQVLDNSPYGGSTSGEVVAAWPQKDFIYFMMHPQGSLQSFGYGLSPIEAVLSVVANILNADNYNGTYFEEGSFPPVILQLIGQTTERDLQRYREYLFQELQGNFHRPAIMAGTQEAKVINLKELTNRDMQFMDYMTFLARLLTAAYGLSPQDIGITDDLNRATAEVQQDLSQSKGYGSILSLLKEVFTREIIWRDFGYKDLEFEWVADDTLAKKDAADIYGGLSASGLMTINEVREKLGEQPYGDWADVPMVKGMNGYVPVIAQENPDEQKQSEMPAEDNQELKKSIYTPDGYETFVDDRGFGQPFIFVNILSGDGKVIKPPVAVNVTSQELEVDITHDLASSGLNVPVVEKKTEVDVVSMMPTPDVLVEFRKYQMMDPAYDSKKWSSKFGKSRKFPYYLVSQYVYGRNLKDTILIEDMKRDPKSYRQAIKDLAALWIAEKTMVLGDRRADQYIITPDKRAFGFDYQFKGDVKRWEGTKMSIVNALAQVPELQKLFVSLISDSKKSGIVETVKNIVKATIGVPGETPSSLQETPVVFGKMVSSVYFKDKMKELFSRNASVELVNFGFQEWSHFYDFNQALSAMKDYVEKNNESVAGIITTTDDSGVKYIIYTYNGKLS